MYQPGELLRFSPFKFKNGMQPKSKFFIVLGEVDEKVIMAVLPTSKDHIPADAVVERGCVSLQERGVNAFVFSPSDPVTLSFNFAKPTFVYGEQVDEYEKEYLDVMESQVEHLGVILPATFQAVKDCIKQATLLRRKYRDLL